MVPNDECEGTLRNVKTIVSGNPNSNYRFLSSGNRKTFYSNLGTKKTVNSPRPRPLVHWRKHVLGASYKKVLHTLTQLKNDKAPPSLQSWSHPRAALQFYKCGEQLRLS